jgi:hypothetical protein
MKTALVVITFPYGKDKDDEQKAYQLLLEQAAEQEGKAKGVERLDRNVWLIDVHTGQRFLAWLLASASAPPVSRPAKVMYFDHDGWIQL